MWQERIFQGLVHYTFHTTQQQPSKKNKLPIRDTTKFVNKLLMR
jgi:hypothetical protein